MTREILNGLRPETYEHIWDLNAKKVLKSVPLLDAAIKKLYEFFSDRVIMLEHKASYLELNSKQYSRIYDIFTECCQILDVKQPPLFMVRNEDINAYTMGISEPLVCVNSGTIQYLTEDELRFIFGHELGHIKSQHLLYKTLANYLQRGGNEILIGAFPLVGIVGVITLNSALYKWNRMSEFTADRAGLLCVQDIEAASSGLSKLSGFLTFTDDNFNKEEFMNQAERFHEEFKEGTAAMLANVKIMLGDVTHPYTLSRVYELNEWYKTGQYTNVVNQFTRKLLDDNNTADNKNIKFKKCNFCGFENNILQAKFCSKCGAAFES